MVNKRLLYYRLFGQQSPLEKWSELLLKETHVVDLSNIYFPSFWFLITSTKMGAQCQWRLSKWSIHQINLSSTKNYNFNCHLGANLFSHIKEEKCNVNFVFKIVEYTFTPTLLSNPITDYYLVPSLLCWSVNRLLSTNTIQDTIIWR